MNKKEIYKRLYYIATFDGYLQLQNNCKYHKLRIRMLEKHQDYFNMVKETLDAANIGYGIYMPKIGERNLNQQMEIQSHQHPILTKLHDRIYMQGRKIIDPHMLKFMDAECLAIMLMTDGSGMLLKGAKARDYRFHLNSHTYGDLLMVKAKLKEVFGLESNIRSKGNGYDLCIPRFHARLLEEIVEPFIFASFSYKLGR